MILKRPIRAVAIFIADFAAAVASAAGSQTDCNKALTTAKAQHKDVFHSFSGSDWCGPGIAMIKRVFSKTEFLAYADKHLYSGRCRRSQVKAAARGTCETERAAEV